MNENRCPQCDLLNLASAAVCLKCGAYLSPSPKKEFSEAKTAEYKQPGPSFHEKPTAEYPGTMPDLSASFATPESGGRIGSRTYFWYRLLCSLIVVGGSVLAILGVVAILGSFSMEGKEAADGITGGIFFLISGAVPALLFLIGVVAPPRSWSWILGVLLLILASLSCFLLPVTIPLFYFWMKSETQMFFGRN